MRTIEPAHQEAVPTRRSGRSPGTRALRRGAAAVATVVAVVALAGCYGPVTTTGIDVTVDCHYQVDDGPLNDAGTSVLHVSLDAPTWSNPGAAIPLNNPTITGTQASATMPGVAVIHVAVSGLDDFQTGVVLSPEDVAYFTNAFAALTPFQDFPSVTTGVTAPQHGVATVDFTEFTSVQVAGVVVKVDCVPVTGQSTRLAAIEIRGDHNY
jgi:hypothetical protein